MKSIGVVKERPSRENRVALVPASVRELVKAKATVFIEIGAGCGAGYSDEEYVLAGAELVENRDMLIAQSDIIVAIDGSELAEATLHQKILIGLFDPHSHSSLMHSLNQQRATVLALEMIPRTSRAQSMDVLSSQANLAGYVAVINAAQRLNKIMPLFMTAAGTIKPARVLILGAGVAGLQAIATAKRLGAQVFAYDVRAAVKEQVESLGAKFVEISIDEAGEGTGGYAKVLSEESVAKQKSLLSDFAKDCDIIITTAQIPGRTAPRLLDDRIFAELKPGSVVIDMAAKSGGNVAGSVLNEWVKVENVWLYGADHLARQVPKDASFAFSKNIKALLDLFLVEGFSLSDEIIRGTTICHEGEWVNWDFGA